MKDDGLYLLHIKECTRRIEAYSSEGRQAFFSDTKTQDAVIRNLQILSESTKRLSEALKKEHPDIDWKNIAAFRNVVVHDYLGVDLNLIWHIVEFDIPELKAKVENILLMGFGEE